MKDLTFCWLGHICCQSNQQKNVQFCTESFLSEFLQMDEKRIAVRLRRVIRLNSRRAKGWTFLSWYSFMTKTWSALLDHGYSACLTRTNDGRPSAYMLTAAQPHPGNDCVINPEPFSKLLLTAEGENGTQTVSAHLSPKHRGGWFDPGWLSVIVKDRATVERDRIHTQTRPGFNYFRCMFWWNCVFSVSDFCHINKKLEKQHNDSLSETPIQFSTDLSCNG